jgi:hypothetical protein
MTDMYPSSSMCGLTIMSIHVGFMVMKKTDLSMKTWCKFNKDSRQ